MKNLLYLFIVVFVMCMPSCKSKYDCLLDETTEDYQLYDYYVDEFGNEGIIAYIWEYDKDDSHKREVIAISATESYLSWGPTNEVVFPLDTPLVSLYNSKGFGIEMLRLMWEKGINRYPAQAWCFAMNGQYAIPYGGSWHLPSNSEMYYIFTGKSETEKVDAINTALTSIGGTPLTIDDFYWTCTEDYDDYITISGASSDYDKYNRAVILEPRRYTTSYKDVWLKKYAHRVRAIKYVKYVYTYQD